MILVSIYINFTIFLKHPRTQIGYTCAFNDVFFYITLKLNGEDLNVCYSLYVFTSISSSYFITDYLSVLVPYIFTSFSNTSGYCNCRICVSVPHVFTSFSNMLLCAIPEPVVSVPYVFTSFSNRNIRSFRDCRFQYHTFLHHSQTDALARVGISKFQYHTFLHHSQTIRLNSAHFTQFQYHTFLHHSQTDIIQLLSSILFQYHTFLHHSQTPMIILYVPAGFQYHTFLHHSQTRVNGQKVLLSFSTIHFYIILKHPFQSIVDGYVSVPYIFTSFSNLKFKNEPPSFAQNKVLKHI